MSKIFFAACGSIGHIAPCIAIWRAVQEVDPQAQAHFVCAEREEEMRFLHEENVVATPLGGRRVRLLTLPVILLRAWSLLRKENPDVIFTKGGGITIPIALAAFLLRIPIVVHESDAVPGRATKLISRMARVVCFGFPQKVTSYGLREHALATRNSQLVTGNPLRPGITSGSREAGLKLTGLSGTRPILLIMGGSQGATAINECVKTHLRALLEIVDIVHITGEGKSGATPVPGKYWTTAFAHQELAHLYAIADLALSRGGSGSITELAANGIPALIVPLEGLAQNHQMANALAAEQSGGAMVLRQETLDQSLVPTLKQWTENLPGLEERGKRFLGFVKPHADIETAKILLAISRERCPVS